ncbi:MAG: LysR family transcriptional regulator [bacterium]|nr:LysR family transcriptional regulator [bacterium]
MEIQQLKGFLAVARHRNFTVAARNTHRTQPTISLQIKALEDELGTKLFERLGANKILLTEDGQLLFELAKPVVEQFEALTERFQEKRGLFNQSTVRIVTHRSVMVYLLPSVIKRFKDIFPDCRLQILHRSNPEIISLLKDGAVDFGISSIQNAPSSIVYEPMGSFRRLLIVSKNHPLTRCENITLADIARYPLILPTEESNTRTMIDSVFTSHDLDYSVSMEVVGRDAIKSYVGMDLGISVMNEYYISEEERRNLHLIDVSQHFGAAETGIIRRAQHDLAKPAEEFLRLLKEEFESSMNNRPLI